MDTSNIQAPKTDRLVRTRLVVLAEPRRLFLYALAVFRNEYCNTAYAEQMITYTPGIL